MEFVNDNSGDYPAITHSENKRDQRCLLKTAVATRAQYITDNLTINKENAPGHIVGRTKPSAIAAASFGKTSLALSRALRHPREDNADQRPF